MQARFYLPMHGRFASPDPARDQHFEETQSWNIYSYVQNNPVMLTDPTGMYSWRELGSDLGSAVKDLAVNNPITQGFLQVSDTLNAGLNSTFGTNYYMASNLGQAAERGAGGLEMTVHALSGPRDVMAAAIVGKGIDKVVGVAEGALLNRAASSATSEGAAAGASEASSVNAKAALNSKLSALENAQTTAAEIRTLPDGRVRYYGPETPATNPGPTRGASYVTEHNPKTGGVRSWMESRNHAGKVNRVHPKMINGQQVTSQHYPPTLKELGK